VKADEVVPVTAVTWNLPAVDGLTVDDIQDTPENLRVELHNGDLVIKLPGTLWHEKVAEAVAAWFGRAGRFAATNPGIKRTPRDTRIPDVGVFFREPEAWDTAYHDPSQFEAVVEVWSRSSDEKDRHDMQWYADRGIPEYWLVTPIEGNKRDATITRYRLVVTEGTAGYLHEETTTLAELVARS
jgi:Uma2 family endonuclease